MSIETRKRFDTIFSSSARSAGTNQASNAIKVDRYGIANVFVDVTAIGGAPDQVALTVKIQGSLDGSTWHDLQTFEVLDAVGFRAKRLVVAGFQQLRAVYTLVFVNGTSPTLTFSVKAQLDQLVTAEELVRKGADVKGEGQYASAQTNQQLIAAPGAGKRLVIEEIVFSNGATAGKFKLVQDTGDPSDLTKEFFFPINGGMIWKPTKPLVLAENVNLGLTSTTVTTHSITVTGYQEILT